VPLHDPVLSRCWPIFRFLAPLWVIVATITVSLVGRDDSTLHINMLIATALGTGLTFLLGTSLMTLVFLSAESRHDDVAAARLHQEDE
jgi:hypothetical protein